MLSAVPGVFLQPDQGLQPRVGKEVAPVGLGRVDPAALGAASGPVGGDWRFRALEIGHWGRATCEQNCSRHAKYPLAQPGGGRASECGQQAGLAKEVHDNETVTIALFSRCDAMGMPESGGRSPAN